MLGNFCATEADGKYEGHSAVTLVHPGGISIHTLTNWEPDTRFAEMFKLGRNWSKSGHAMVPVGHDTLSGPVGPREPDTPTDPEIVLGPHDCAV